MQQVQIPEHAFSKQNVFPVQKGRCKEVHISIWNMLHFQKILKLNMPIEHSTWFLFILIFHCYLLFCRGLCLPWHTFGGQRTTLWSLFTPSPLWFLRTEFRTPGLCGKSLYLLSHLDSPATYFFTDILAGVLINVVVTLVWFFCQTWYFTKTAMIL